MTYDSSADEIGPLQDRSAQAEPERRDANRAVGSSGRDALLWPVYILFRPRKFYESIALMNQKSVLFACAWIFGMSNASNQLSSKLGSSPGMGKIEDDWNLFWALVAGLGRISAAVLYSIGGWWYRVRLRWSGVSDPDPYVARRVYITAAQVFAAPDVLAAAIAPVLFATPLEAAESPALGLWALVMMPMRIWSFVVSYIGVSTVFRPKPWPARIWFLILPITLTCAVFVLILVLGIMAAAAQTP